MDTISRKKENPDFIKEVEKLFVQLDLDTDQKRQEFRKFETPNSEPNEKKVDIRVVTDTKTNG